MSSVNQKNNSIDSRECNRSEQKSEYRPTLMSKLIVTNKNASSQTCLSGYISKPENYTAVSKYWQEGRYNKNGYTQKCSIYTTENEKAASPSEKVKKSMSKSSEDKVSKICANSIESESTLKLFSKDKTKKLKTSKSSSKSHIADDGLSECSFTPIIDSNLSLCIFVSQNQVARSAIPKLIDTNLKKHKTIDCIKFNYTTPKAHEEKFRQKTITEKAKLDNTFHPLSTIFIPEDSINKNCGQNALFQIKEVINYFEKGQFPEISLARQVLKIPIKGNYRFTYFKTIQNPIYLYVDFYFDKQTLKAIQLDSATLHSLGFTANYDYLIRYNNLALKYNGADVRMMEFLNQNLNSELSSQCIQNPSIFESAEKLKIDLYNPNILEIEKIVETIWNKGDNAANYFVSLCVIPEENIFSNQDLDESKIEDKIFYTDNLHQAIEVLSRQAPLIESAYSNGKIVQACIAYSVIPTIKK